MEILNNTLSFLYDQGIDVGTQYIKYLTISIWVTIGVAILLLLISSGTTLYAILKKRLVLGLIAGLVVLGSVGIIGSKMDDALKITVAPKVFVIEKGYGAVKQVVKDFKSDSVLKEEKSENNEGSLLGLILFFTVPLLILFMFMHGTRNDRDDETF